MLAPVTAAPIARCPKCCTGRTAPWLVWTVWGTMTAGGLWFASVYGLRLPFADEMEFLPQMCGQAPLSPAWLWHPHGEHRILLPRLIYFGLGWATNFDFRAGAFWSAAMLAALSAAMILAARAVRGHSSVYDAFFPLAIQHWGQPLNLIWGFQIAFTTGTFLVGIVLTIMARCRGNLSPVAAAAMTVSVACAGLCGANGVPFVPAVACWLIVAALVAPPAAKTKRVWQALTFMALAAILIALLVAYFRDLHRPAQDHAPPGAGAILQTALEFLATSLGMVAAKEAWPVSGILVLLGCICSIAQLIGVLKHRPEERVRASGFLAFLGALLLLALGIGWGRAGSVPQAGMQDRYVTLAIPLWCLFYLQWLAHCGPSQGKHLQRTLFALGCVLVAVNSVKGLQYAQTFQGYFARLEADMRAGIPPEALAVRNADRFSFSDVPLLAAQLQMLHAGRRGPYREDAAYRIDPRIHAWRLVELTQPDRRQRAWEFQPGAVFRQPFLLKAGMALVRIDVEMDSVAHRRLCRRLDWTLSQREADGRSTTVARGHTDPAQLETGQYVSIPLDRIAFPQTTELLLDLAMARDATQGEGLRLFLFDGPTPGHVLGHDVCTPEAGSLHAFALGMVQDSR